MTWMGRKMMNSAAMKSMPVIAMVPSAIAAGTIEAKDA
jgi:hypothetical protein